jgi:hypothetical protein
MIANPPVTKVARRILRFTRPWDQFLIVLPTLTSMAFIALVSYSVLVHVRQAALQALSDVSAVPPIVQRFETEVGLFLFIYWVSAVVLGLIGFLWVALVTYRVFGPFSRLERELIAIRDGIMDPAGLRVRQTDAIHTIVELFRQVLTQRSK